MRTTSDHTTPANTPPASSIPSTSGRTLGEFATDWLSLRRPGRLVVDGVFVLAFSGLVYIGWTEFVERTGQSPYVGSPTTDIPAIVQHLGYLFSGGYAASHYLGLILIIVGCVRFIADAIRAK